MARRSQSTGRRRRGARHSATWSAGCRACAWRAARIRRRCSAPPLSGARRTRRPSPRTRWRLPGSSSTSRCFPSYPRYLTSVRSSARRERSASTGCGYASGADRLAGVSDPTAAGGSARRDRPPLRPHPYRSTGKWGTWGATHRTRRPSSTNCLFGGCRVNGARGSTSPRPRPSAYTGPPQPAIPTTSRTDRQANGAPGARHTVRGVPAAPIACLGDLFGAGG